MQLNQSLAQTQTLRMNPQLYQSIKLMELPSLDLRDKIQEELERNPALEIIEDKSVLSLERNFQYSKKVNEKASNEYRQFIEGTLSRSETLQEHLLWQLQLEKTDDELRKIAETLIQNLNDDGFHIVDPITLFDNMEEISADKNKIEKAMSIIRKMEPAGCCTKDFTESLKIQIKLIPHFLPEEIPDEAIEILLDNLDLIEKEKYSILAKKIKFYDEEDIRDISELIKSLSPFPGRSFTSSAESNQYVIPDINIEKKTNDEGDIELLINLNDEAFPVLGINKFYEKLTDSEKNADDANSKKIMEAREFARKNIIEARLFIDHLKKRNQTLIRVTNAILHFQKEFFFKGPKYLAPLTQKDIATELDVHETTVSRIANGKYMQTEWGIYEIKYFFSNSVGKIGNSGSENIGVSKESVKEIIKEIISAENGRVSQGGNKLSDNEISALLAQRGIAIARRTVAKYRKELDMGSSYNRRK